MKRAREETTTITMESDDCSDEKRPSNDNGSQWLIEFFELRSRLYKYWHAYNFGEPDTPNGDAARLHQDLITATPYEQLRHVLYENWWCPSDCDTYAKIWQIEYTELQSRYPEKYMTYLVNRKNLGFSEDDAIRAHDTDVVMCPLCAGVRWDQDNEVISFYRHGFAVRRLDLIRMQRCMRGFWRPPLDYGDDKGYFSEE